MKFETTIAVGILAAMIAKPLSAQQNSDAAALAQAAQNSIADMISLPFQINTNFDVRTNSCTNSHTN